MRSTDTLYNISVEIASGQSKGDIKTDSRTATSKPRAW